jgi:hypothetical protein
VRVLFVFLDGVGIGPPDPEVNPFLRAELPTLRGLLGGALPTLDGPRVEAGDSAAAFPLDANLGMEGTPQSGTGQTALLTGVHAPARFGRHFGPWVPVALRPVVEEESVLRRAVRGGREVAFANAYPTGWPRSTGDRWPAAPPLAARAAGLLVRHAEALAQEDAVASEIVNDRWRRLPGLAQLPTPTPKGAGRTLGRLAGRHDLTLFAHYSTDHAGHEDGMDGAVTALERVDRFLAGILETLGDDTLLLIASDHGNIEDVTQGHTRNPVLGLLAGPGAEGRSRDLHSITDVAPAVEGWLEP